MAGETETAWPEYELPAGALSDDAAREPATETTPPASSVAAPPPVETPTPPPVAGAPGSTEPPASPTPPPSELLPKYRLDEANEKTRLAIARAEAAERELAQLRSRPPQPPATPAPVTAPAPPIDPEVAEKNAAIRARMLEVFPEFAKLERLVKLADQGEVIEGATDAIQGYREAVSLYFDQFAKTQVSGLEAMAATALLGDGKKAEDLSEAAREQIGLAFFTWLKKDPARAARFDRLDPTLVGEFWPSYKAAVFDPIRRVESAAAIHAVEHRQPVPTGGSTTAPMTPAPPKPAVPHDEDAIHAAAWKEVVASRG